VPIQARAFLIARSECSCRRRQEASCWQRKVPAAPRSFPLAQGVVRKNYLHQQSNMGRGTDRNELLLKIGIQISPRTVRRYMPKTPKRPMDPTQRWMTFVRNHVKAMIASDFFVVVTATFQLVYVFVIMEVDTRRILHFNVTRHPTAEWTLQQFRECVTGDEGYRFAIHDRDRIYSRDWTYH
jgi:putative transposase